MIVSLNCKIAIERKSDNALLTFTSLNNCEIEKSIYQLGTTAKIKIPASARLRQSGTLATDSVQVGKQFARGDKVTIQLGYNNDLRTEFTGFIYRINFTTPLEIECEGYEFMLRSNYEAKTYKSTNLKEVVAYLLDGTGVKISQDLPKINYTNFILPAAKSRLEMMQEIKDKYGLTAYFIDDLLYIGLAYTPDFGMVKYAIGINTIKDNELKYRYGADVRLKVKAICIKKDNTRIEAEIGDKDGQIRTLYFYDITSKEELNKLAIQEIEKYKYDGYEGKITAFLQPFAQPGMRADLSDPIYSEKSGVFYITGSKVTFGRNGARRIVEIGIKIQDGKK